MASKNVYSVRLVNGCWTVLCVISPSGERWYWLNNVVRLMYGTSLKSEMMKKFLPTDMRSFGELCSVRTTDTELSVSTVFVHGDAVKSYFISEASHFLNEYMEHPVLREVVMRLFTFDQIPLSSRDWRPIARIQSENSLFAALYVWAFNVWSGKYDDEFDVLVARETAGIATSTVVDEDSFDSSDYNVQRNNDNFVSSADMSEDDVEEITINKTNSDHWSRVLKLLPFDVVYSHMLREMEAVFSVFNIRSCSFEKHLYESLEKYLVETMQTVVDVSYSIYGDVVVKYGKRNCLDAVYDRVKWNVRFSIIHRQQAVLSNDLSYFDTAVEKALINVKAKLPWHLAMSVLTDVHNGNVHFVHRVPVTDCSIFDEYFENEKQYLNEEAFFHSAERHKFDVACKENPQMFLSNVNAMSMMFPESVYLNAFHECPVDTTETCGVIDWPARQVNMLGYGPNGKKWVHLDQQIVGRIKRIYRQSLEFRSLSINGRDEETTCSIGFDSCKYKCLHERDSVDPEPPRRYSRLHSALRSNVNV